MAIEEKLKKALRKGDAERVRIVCSGIFAKYKRLMFSLAYQILKNQEDAEDATQDAFIALFSRLKPDFEFSSIKYYLLNSVRFISYKIKKERAKFADEFPEEELGLSEDVMRRLDELESLSYLRKALSEEELTIVLKHLLEEKTFREIAKEKGVSENSISAKYRRALDKVRKERNT